MDRLGRNNNREKVMNSRTPLIIILMFALVSFLISCHKDIQTEKEIYRNDFESGNLESIENGSVNTFNGSRVTGFYNNSGFKLSLPGLEKHDLLKVTFDLYIHDSWAGNNTGNSEVIDGPDIWEMLIDNKMFIQTTFSNSGCFPTYCQQQSYPRNYPFHNDAGTGASRLDLPGVCQLQNVIGGSSMYKIVKYINHSDRNLEIEFRDKLKQSNAKGTLLCDESWSMDNISVTVITLN